MITSPFNPQMRPIRVALPSIERKVRGAPVAQDLRQEGLDFQKKVYGRSTALPGLRKPKLSSNSISSKDTQATSDRCLTGDDSLNDLSRITPTPPNRLSNNDK